MSDTNNVADATKPEGTADVKTYPENVVKEIIAQRDSTKTALKEMQVEFDKIKAQLNQVSEDELKKKGDLQTLLDSKVKEIEETKKTLTEISEYKTKYEDLDKSIRENLLSQLPDELKEVAEDLTTLKLQKFVDLNKSQTAGMDNGRSGKSKISIEGKKYSDFTSKDLQIIRDSDFEGYSRLYKEKFGYLPTL